MKKGLFTLLLFVSITSFSQIYLKGKVTTTSNEILEGASVYLNNTTIGTSTDEKGEFQLKIDKGVHNLIVSFIGFKTINHTINTNIKINAFHFKLTPESNILNEVVLRKTKYDNDWWYNLNRFKQAFLGRTNLAKECIILNPKVLHFEYNAVKNKLTAYAKEPLKIKHKGLGYLIEYDLANFSIKGKYISYSGYSKYSNLKPTLKKKWKRKRQKAYHGSQMHFFRSLLQKKLTEEGFVINQFIRKPNPDRPTEIQIKMARELIRLYPKKIDFFKEIKKPVTPLDSAIVISKKISLPKYKDYLYKRNVPYKDIYVIDNNTPYLSFKNHLSIIFKNEKEELNYVAGLFGKRRKASNVQSSNITLIVEKPIINKAGILINPHAIITEGYWSYESFANMLPLNYQIKKEKR